MLPIVINFLLAINIIVSLLIVLLVLMQRPKNEGLGAAFGGGMTENLFGAQTTNVLQTITRWLGAMFFGLSLLLSWLYVKKDVTHSALQQRLSAPTIIPTTPPPVIPKGIPTALPEGVVPAVNPEALEQAKPGEALKLEMTPPGAEAPRLVPIPEPGTPAPTPAAPKSEVPAPAAPAPAPKALPEGAAVPPAPEPAKPAPAPEPAKPEGAPAPPPQ